MSAMLLSAHDLYKEYESGEGICTAVNHVNLDMEKGDFISIVGTSGSGKSSLLYLLSGMLEMTSGEVFYMGKSLSEMTDRQKADYRGKEIGFVFQDENLLEDLTVLKNVALPGYLYRSRKEADERAEKWLDLLGLGNQKNKYPSQLSGGQRQKAAIARALLNQTKIIFLDEPTGSLDGAASENILHLLVKLNQKGQSIVMVTHDMEAAARGSKVLMIKDGSVQKSLVLGRYENKNAKERKVMLDSFLHEGTVVNS